MIAQAIVLLAVLLALRSRAWWPIAITLGVPLACDVAVPLVGLPPQYDMALWLVWPALAAWAAWVVLARDPVRARFCMLFYLGATLVLLAVSAAWVRPAWWCLPLAGRLTGLATQIAAATSFARSPRPGGAVEAAALVLLAGDVASLLGPAGVVPGPWDLASMQAGVVAAGVVALQVARPGGNDPRGH